MPFRNIVTNVEVGSGAPSAGALPVYVDAATAKAYVSGIGDAGFRVLNSFDGAGSAFFVSGSSAGSDSNSGASWEDGFASVQAAVTAASAGDTVFIAPGAYDEVVTIARAKSNLTLIGVGGRGSVFIAPEADNTTAVTNLADDVTLINVGCDGEGTGGGLLNYGDRLRAYGCKFEGGTNALLLTLGTVAQEAAGTHGTGADLLFDDCEFAWCTNGVKLVASDYGAVTQVRFRNCHFFACTAASFEESGGTASIRFRDLHIVDCTFGHNEDALPTKWLSLNDDNGNTGMVSGCRFPTAIDSGLNLVSTSVLWIGNFHTGGISAAQPS